MTTRWTYQGVHEEHGHDIWEPEAFCITNTVQDCPEEKMKVHTWNSETETGTFSCHTVHHNPDSHTERQKVFHEHGSHEEDECGWVEFNFEEGCHDDPEGLVQGEAFTCADGIEYAGGLGECDSCIEVGGGQWR